MRNIFVFVALPKCKGDLNETWFKERSQCIVAKEHNTRGMLYMYVLPFSKKYSLWT
jgi:hypothetical protein